MAGKPVGSLARPTYHIVQFSSDETTEVGRDTGSPVTDAYPDRDNGCTGEIRWVRLDVGDDDHNHLIPPEAKLDLLMTCQ